MRAGVPLPADSRHLARYAVTSPRADSHHPVCFAARPPQTDSHHPVSYAATPPRAGGEEKNISPLLFKEGWREATGWLQPSA